MSAFVEDGMSLRAATLVFAKALRVRFVQDATEPRK
jgi:hypothetical protein